MMSKEILWIAKDYCPDNQLQKSGGSPRDAGYDLRVAEDCWVLPYQDLSTSTERVCPVSEWKGDMPDSARWCYDYDPDTRVKYIARTKYDVQTIKTGIVLAHPERYAQYFLGMSWVMAAPRSSASKYGVALANTIGVIDIDYTGEVGIRAYTYGDIPQPFRRGEAFAQLIPVPQYGAIHFTRLAVDPRTTERGGWGSTT